MILPDLIGLANELQKLLDVRARLNTRLRALTGKNTTSDAVHRGYVLIEEIRDEMERVERKAQRKAIKRGKYGPPITTDERVASESIDAWSGGLPTLGKGHR